MQRDRIRRSEQDAGLTTRGDQAVGLVCLLILGWFVAIGLWMTVDFCVAWGLAVLREVWG